MNSALQNFTLDSCHLIAQVEIAPRDVALFKLNFANTTGNNFGPLNTGDTIYSSDRSTSVTFKDLDVFAGILYLQVIDRNAFVSETLQIQI